MLAVVGWSADAVGEAISAGGFGDVWVANVNSSRQVVVTGLRRSIDRFAAYLGATAEPPRVKALKTGGAFHSPLMDPAAEEFGRAVETVDFHDPTIYMPSNATGRSLSGSDWKRHIVDQLISPVRWDLCARQLHSLASEFREMSDRSVLTRLMNQLESTGA
jgi:malonyl CoA-acyl carrier protein transacylase